MQLLIMRKHRKSSRDSDKEIVTETRCQRCAFVFVKCLRRFIAFLFSHIGLTCLVAGYAILGGLIFKAVELPQEKEIRKDVVDKKDFYVNKIVDMFDGVDLESLLEKKTTTDSINTLLKEYQNEVYGFTKDRDWDGRFEGDDFQWSFAESLLYSVTVISTIGYGNITPKTLGGRMLTLFYGIVGIPLTMLCLHNIGNLMASCFRLIYRVACINMTYQYIKLKRRRIKQKFVKRLKGKTRVLQEWAKRQHSHVSSLLHNSHIDVREEEKEFELIEVEEPFGQSRQSDLLPPYNTTVSNLNETKRRAKTRRHSDYTIGKTKVRGNERKLSLPVHHESRTMHPKFADLMTIPEDEIADVTIEDIEQKITKEEISVDSDHASGTTSSLSLTDFDREERILKAKLKDTRDLVPISVCLLIMTGYIILGALIFTSWEEDWNFLVAFYFCFITLTTIGFGDFVPGMGRLDNDEKRVFGALYLFFGMALLAMSFHLIQEEVRHKCRKLAVRIGLIEQKLTDILDNYEEKHGLHETIPAKGEVEDQNEAIEQL